MTGARCGWLVCASSRRTRRDGSSTSGFRRQQNQPRGRPGLPLLQSADWNPNLPYDESPPTCIHYSIEWKLLLKKGRLSKLTNDTEQNLVLAQGAFWDQTLEPKLQQFLAKKTPRNKCYEPDETNVVVSGVVENQLVAWSYLLRDGRQLRIDILFIYKETTQQVAGNMLRTYGDQDLEHRKRKRQASLSDGLPPIHITNVMPARCNQDSAGWSTGSTPETREETHIWHATKLNIPRPINESLHRYSWKNGYQDACRIALEEGLDLERLYNAQDRGIAI
ncbi:hypothetical protein B0T18DRAFT_479520 [Schizothecium vesticola]|uniref:Uncharacterized protein n=1 Tax=Schizothecium vesticola TaxID=314040 RepID=A0AA40F1H5_9PEZI|nr:hypothetical protein B0T18DRAFT_479520 [Schizothecium vesticola]